MRNARYFLAGTAVAAMLALAGCGSNLDSGGDITVGVGGYGQDTSGRAFVGANLCIQCHASFSWSAREVQDYLEGKHVIHSSHVTAAETECLRCHDPIKDGRTVEQFIDSADVPAGGLAAVTCEACHGAGGEHFGAGPIPVPSPGPEACGSGRCHSELPADDHRVYHPEANNIVEKYLASVHGTATSLHNDPLCTKCHNHEGGLMYKDVTTAQQLAFSVLPVPEASNIQCKTCHNPHNAGELLKSQIVTRQGKVTVSAEYNTCSNCHQNHDADLNADDDVMVVRGITPVPDDSTDGSLVKSDGTTVLLYHAKRLERIMTDTHYDYPATADRVEGYAMDKTNEHVCRDCHDVHAADASSEESFNFQWAESGHAGKILQAKEEAAAAEEDETLAQTRAVQAAGSDGEDFSWGHYDWDASNRASCQMCHTATGAKNFLHNQASYVAADNDFSHLVGWSRVNGTVTSSGQNELLFCWGCHADNSGALRNPGPVKLAYKVDGVEPTIDDVADSNVCVNCHGGRGNMDKLVIAGSPAGVFNATTAAPGASVKIPANANDNANKVTATQTHYELAAASIYHEKTRVGYQYYADSMYEDSDDDYEHGGIGLATGDGPCVTCHMKTDEGHAWEIVRKDASGVIVAINSQAICDGCHTAGSMDPADLDAKIKGYQEANQALADALADVDIYFLPATYPYFFTTPTLDDPNAPTFDETFYQWPDMGTLGVAHNLGMLYHEPGSFAHNSVYAKRLIYDSLDWLNDGLLDGDVVIDPSDYPDAAAWFEAGTGGAVTRPN